MRTRLIGSKLLGAFTAVEPARGTRTYDKRQFRFYPEKPLASSTYSAWAPSKARLPNSWLLRHREEYPLLQ